MLKKQRIALSFAAAALIPIGVLGWFGVRVLQMDRDVEKQRASEGLEIAAKRLALDIEGRLQEIEDRLGRGDDLQFTSAGIHAGSGSPVLYQPLLPPLSFASS